MTPRQLANHLRIMAHRIDISNNPSRSMVAAELQRLIRFASRNDVINQVTQNFNKYDIYPPSMKEISKNKYTGTIDSGWELEVEELTGGILKILLNGKKCSSLQDAVLAFKKKDPNFSSSGPSSKSKSSNPSGHIGYKFPGINGDIPYTFRSLEISKDGLFKSDISWTLTTDDGDQFDIRSIVNYRMVESYDSIDNSISSYSVNGKEYGTADNAKDSGAFGKDYDDTILNPDSASDLSFLDFIDRNFSEEWSEWNQEHDIHHMDQQAIDDLYSISDDGRFV